MINSVLKITSTNGGCLGTCFVIDKDEEGIYVATCGHVVKKCRDAVLVEDKEAKIIKNNYDTGLDLAILYVKDLHFKPLKVNNNETAKLATVIGYSHLIAHPKKEAIENISIKHNIEYCTPEKVNIMKLTTKETISNGYSGSPVICETSNDVIGIVNIEAGDETNYAICAKHLSEIYTIKDDEISENIEIEKYPKITLKTTLGEVDIQVIKRELEKNFENSLKTFANQVNTWITPRLHSIEETVTTTEKAEDTRVDLAILLDTPHNFIIRAREQYGLTSLSHYLVKEAWMQENPSFWIRIDANKLKPHTVEIKKYVDEILNEYGLQFEDIECVVLDEFSTNLKNADKIFNKIFSYFKNIPIITMLTLYDNPLLNEKIVLPENRDFYNLHLWSLHRSAIRQVVIDYNDKKFIGNENDVVNKIVSDLDVLNIPRTALNCLTILKISESGFDDSPVNRTEMLSRILSLLFNVDNMPGYKTRPDMKDTEYILGYYCELMIRKNQYYFTRENFLSCLNDFCKKMEIDLEIDTLFQILFENTIIIQRGSEFCFKFSYWVFYFAAERMHKNKEFATFMLSDMNYTSYPELIEFYTGIERNRNEALEILTQDMSEICKTVNEKCGLPESFDIYDIAKWKPNEEQVEQMAEEVSEGVLQSKLPDVVKDEYADKGYDNTRPLNQEIHQILEEYSLLRLMKSIKACSKALRNSDYAEPKIKHNLLREIMKGWLQLTNVLIALSPILSKDGRATLDGASFVLQDNFGETYEQRLTTLIAFIPTNIVNWYKDDLFSTKMSSLLVNHIRNEDSKIKNHYLNLLLVYKKPKKWEEHIEEYIIKEHKNSFYLYDIYKTLLGEYKFSFTSNFNLKNMEKFIKITAAKHDIGIKNPSKKVIDRLDEKNAFADVIPTRELED